MVQAMTLIWILYGINLIATSAAWILYNNAKHELAASEKILKSERFSLNYNNSYCAALQQEISILRNRLESDKMIVITAARLLEDIAAQKEHKRIARKERRHMVKMGSKGKSPGAGIKKDSRQVKPGKSVAPVYAGTKLATQKGKAGSKKARA